MASSSPRIGTMMTTSASSLKIEAWGRKGSNFAYSGFYQLTVFSIFIIYWIAKCHNCKKEETEEAPAKS
jgi:hypothetical protein